MHKIKTLKVLLSCHEKIKANYKHQPNHRYAWAITEIIKTEHIENIKTHVRHFKLGLQYYKIKTLN